MVTKSPEKRSARDRLLDAADELFYDQGIHTVGIDTIIERAGVAKASLYSTFGSKDELIRAHLERRFQERNDRLTLGLEKFTTPRDRLLGVFDVQATTFARPTYRGCAFMNASAESPRGGVVEEVSDASRGWTKKLFTGLARDAGVNNPSAFAAQLCLLYDGAIITSRMDRNPRAAQTAKAAATVLLDAALAAK